MSKTAGRYHECGKVKDVVCSKPECFKSASYLDLHTNLLVCKKHAVEEESGVVPRGKVKEGRYFATFNETHPMSNTYCVVYARNTESAIHGLIEVFGSWNRGVYLTKKEANIKNLGLKLLLKLYVR